MSQLDVLLASKRADIRARDTSAWSEKERLLLESCHPKQREFVLDPGKRIAALVARGGGKTTGGRARLVRRMLRTPRAKCLYIAVTRVQAEELMWIPLKELCERLGIEATFNETKLRCTFTKNGATLRLVGADNKAEIEKLRGQPFHEVGIDESASFPAQLLEHLAFRVIGPRLGDYDGTLWFIGTPGHFLEGTFYEATRSSSPIHRRWEDRDLPEYDGWIGWSFHSWSVRDGAPYVPAMRRLWEAALIEKERNKWSDHHPVWLREYLGLWAADDTETVFKYRAHLEDGTEWNQWDPERDPRTGLARLPEGITDWRYVYGLDLGAKDPTALVVFAYSPSERTLYQIYGFERTGMYAKTVAQLLIGDELNSDKPSGIIGSTGWPDAMVADTEGLGDMLLDELSNVYGVRLGKAEKKNKHDAIELFNGDLIDGRIKILKGSNLEQQLIHLQWAVDDFGKIKENKGQANHSTDAAIYARSAAHHQFRDDAPEAKPFFPPRRNVLAEPEEEEDHSRGEYGGLLSDDGDYQDAFWGN